MNILILGDIVGPAGREVLIKKLPSLIIKKKLDFVVINGENAADSGLGITKKNAIFLGIAYSFQKCKSIPVNKHDFKLDYIFTEQGIISSN